MTVQELPTRSAGSNIIDYSLKESDAKLIHNRRKIALTSDKNSAYSSARGETIQFVISPGSDNEWLDGRSSFMTAKIQVSADSFTGPANALQYLYLPNGPASCFSQVQIISASGQQIANILDYSTIQQMFVEWTACPTWKGGIGQMYGIGDAEKGQWDPAVFDPLENNNVSTYNPHQSGLAKVSYSYTANAAAVGNLNVEQKNAGEALSLQDLVNGVTYAFRLDLAWIFGSEVLIPSQFFPLQMRATLINPNVPLAYCGVSSPLTGATSGGPYGPLSTSPLNPAPIPGIGIATTTGAVGAAAATFINLDLTFSNVRFMASLCEISPTLKAKVDEQMSKEEFQLTVTNYFTSRATISGNNANVNTSFTAHDVQAHWVSLIPQAQESNLNYDFGQRWGNGQIASSQVLVNGTYFPPQPNTTQIDMFHDTLASFNTTSDNVDFSPVSYYSYNGKNFVLGTLFDRDATSHTTGINTVGSPVFTWMANMNNSIDATAPVNVHTCIAYTQVLSVKKDKQIIVWT